MISNRHLDLRGYIGCYFSHVDRTMRVKSVTRSKLTAMPGLDRPEHLLVLEDSAISPLLRHSLKPLASILGGWFVCQAFGPTVEVTVQEADLPGPALRQSLVELVDRGIYDARFRLWRPLDETACALRTPPEPLVLPMFEPVRFAGQIWQVIDCYTTDYAWRTVNRINQDFVVVLEHFPGRVTRVPKLDELLQPPYEFECGDGLSTKVVFFERSLSK